MHLLTGQGRVGRLGYLATLVGVSIAMMVTITALLAGDPTDPSYEVSGAVPLLVVLWIWILLMNDIRRLRDLGLAWYWVFLFLVPIVQLVLLVYLLLVPGVRSESTHRLHVRPSASRRPDPEAVVAQRARLDAYHEQLFNADGTFNRDGLFDDSDLRRR